jgi:hypothetical protein
VPDFAVIDLPWLMAANAAPADSWWDENWFSLVQTIGIVSGLVLGAAALWADMKARREDASARRVETLMLTTQYHRDIWGRILDEGSLNRVLDPTADLDSQPLSEEERMLCTFLILHLFATFEARKAGVFRIDWADSHDVGELFSLPVPSTVWNLVKPYQSEEFVEFVEGARGTWGSV